MSLCFFVFFSFFFFASWQLQSLLKFLYPHWSVFRVFLKNFRKEEGEERGARESFIIAEHRREKN